MEQSLESKKELKNRLGSFYNTNKGKIYFLIFVLTIVLVTLTFLNYKNGKKNILISEKYVEAGINLTSNKKKVALKLYEEILLSENKFYSILALNTIIEKKLILDENKILKYFEILEKSISLDDQKDLIIFKKALFEFKESNISTGNELLQRLIKNNSNLKDLAKEFVNN